MKEKLNELFSKLSFKQYQCIRSGLFWSTMGSSIVRSNIDINGLGSNSLLGLEYLSSFIFCYLTLSNKIEKTKDLTDINNIYNEIINNYASLIKSFDLVNPCEISAFHTDMVEQGLLSVGKKFELKRRPVIDEYKLYGKNIIRGNGVCRHIAVNLKDVLCSLDYDAHVLCVCFPNFGLSINIIDEQKQTQEEIDNVLKRFFYDQEIVNKFKQAIDVITEELKKNVELSLYVEKEKNIFKRLFGNHAICFVVYNGYAYYLDSTLHRVYAMNKEEIGKLFDNEVDKVIAKTSSPAILTMDQDMKRIKSLISNGYPCLDIKEQYELCDKGHTAFNDNLDIIDNFYEDNKEMYEELSNKLKSLKPFRFR